MELISQINAHQYLYLNRLEESTDLKLQVWIDEAKVDSSTGAKDEPFSSYGSIATDDTCRRYKIIFENYLAYSVLNESYEIESENVTEINGRFVSYEESRFLNYCRSIATIDTAESIADARCQHFQVNCLNHVINVATCNTPQIDAIEA